MKILTYIKSHVVISSATGIVVIIAMIIAGRVASRNKAPQANLSNTKKVNLIEVTNFRNDLSKVSADGIVESVSQADIKSQISAPVTSIDAQIGDSVVVGQTLVVLQNADIRAQLDQARAGLALAQGQYTGSSMSLDSAKSSALETIHNSYSTANKIVNSDIDQFLYKSTGNNPQLSFFISDSKLNNSIRDFYLNFPNIQEAWNENMKGLSISSENGEIVKVLSTSQINIENTSVFLDQIATAINTATSKTPSSPDTIALNKWQDTVTADRSKTNTISSTLISAKSGLSNANLSYGSLANAQMSSAQAVVNNLEAQLTKTIFISPITGKIAALPLRTGELAQPGQLIATIVGGGGLQVRAYASGEDLERIKSSAKVLIDGKITGTVVSVAPSVNQSNKKVEVKISVDNGESSDLVIGQNISVSINSTETSASTLESQKYLLPIQDVKIIPGDAFVFTLDPDSKIVKHAVIIGKIQGDFVEVTSGINSDMKIVTPVYELEEGENVTVQ